MVKATIKGKREPMELEGDMILGATIQYDATRDSGVFIIGDVKFTSSENPGSNGGGASEKAFFGNRPGESVCRFLYSISCNCGSSTGGF